MSVPKVLVADPISERGISELAEGGLLEVTVKTGLKEDELLEIIGEYAGLVVRCQTKVTPGGHRGGHESQGRRPRRRRRG